MTAPTSTVVLTGGTGFIGSAVLAQLLERRRRPLVIVRPGSDRRRLARWDGLEVFCSEQLNDPALSEQLKPRQPDVLIHCAWRGVAGAERNAAHQITDNVPLTIHSVELAAACGCRQWIGLGSQAEYGNLNRIIAETAMAQPTTIYGKAKLAAGLAALALCEAKELVGTWLRVFSTYGPGDAPHWMIPFVIREFLRGRSPQVTRCEQLWDYLFVKDAARAILSVAHRRTPGIFNLGSGQALPLRHILEVIRAELQTPLEPAYGAIPYRTDQVMHLQADIGKLRAATGWTPQFTLTEGLRQTVAWEKRLFEAGCEMP